MNRIVAPKFLSNIALSVGVTGGSPTKKIALDDNSFKKIRLPPKQSLTAYKYGKTVKIGAYIAFGDSWLAKKGKKRDSLSTVSLGARGGT